MAFEWFRSYRTEWKLIPIDPKTWSGYVPISGLKSFRIANNADGDAPTIQSGSMLLDLFDGELDFGWYQLYARVVSPTGFMDSFPVATLLFEADGYSYDYSIGTATIQGRSVLHPCSTAHMKNGEYIPKNTNGAEWCRQALANHTPAPVVVDSPAFVINHYYVFDSGTSYLSAVWQVLDSAGWVIRIGGDGVIHLQKKSTKPVVIFEKDALGVMHPGIDYSQDVGSVPNVYNVNWYGKRAQAINNDPNSPVSIASRSYINDRYEANPMLIDGETPEHYANRMLESESTVIKTYSYTREVWEEVCPLDLIRVNVPGVYTGNARVISQRYSCASTDGGLVIEEVIGEEVKLWQMS